MPSCAMLALQVLVLAMIWIAATILWRLCLHPLRHVPGPKLPAATRLYELYYQAFRVSEFPAKVEAMHRKYGPIVRISPDEISISDSAFNMSYFMKDRTLRKDPWYYSFGYSNAVVGVLDKDKHKKRQTHLMQLFGGTYFYKHALPLIEREIDAIRSCFDHAATSRQTLNATTCFRKMCNEVLRDFLLGTSSWESEDNGKLGTPGKIPLFQAIAIMRHFKFLSHVKNALSPHIMALFMPIARHAYEAEIGLRKLIGDYDRLSTQEQTNFPGAMYRLIEVDPDYRQNGCAAAMEEFMEFLWGGREAISSAITQTCLQLVNNPLTMYKLRQELNRCELDLSTASYTKLQSLPYLYGVCKEGIRLTWGGSFRMPRVNSHAVEYQGFVIPANTPISMCPNFFHQDAAVFDDPTSFKPERWIGDPEAVAILESHWRPFGQGCQGRSMAMELVWRTVANIFTHYQLTFHECDKQSIEADGTLKVFPPAGSKGLRVHVAHW